jgi:small-conductance mechanosensitive channel
VPSRPAPFSSLRLVAWAKLRSVSGERLVVSNSDLLRSRIRNYGRIAERRGDFSFGIVTRPIPKWLRGSLAR